MKYCYIVLLFVCLPVKIFAQGSANATIAATIVNSVGAEKSGDVNFSYFSEETSANFAGQISSDSKSPGVIKVQTNDNTSTTSINIIGSEYVYDISLQGQPVIFYHKDGLMKVDLYKKATVHTTELTSFPIGALLTVSDFKNPGLYTSTFNVTVNFN